MTSPSSSLLVTFQPTLTLEAADKIANAAIAAVQDLKTPAPVAITVLDNAGFVIVQKRMTGCPAGAYAKFSYAKARTCIHLQTSSRQFRVKYTGSGEAPKFTQASSMVSIMEGDLLPCAGGVLIKQKETGAIMGAVGVSGAAADEDEYIAFMGIKNGLVNSIIEEEGSTIIGEIITDPPEHSCTTLKDV